MFMAPVIGASVVAALVVGVVVVVATTVVEVVVVVVDVAGHVPLVLSPEVWAHALLPLSAGVATIIQLAKRWVEDAGRVEEILGAGLNAMVRAVAVKAVTSVGTKGLGADRAGEERHQKRWVGGAKHGGHDVDLLVVPKGQVRFVAAERIGVIFGHDHHQGIEG